MDKLHNYKFVIQLKLPDGREWVKQIALVHGYSGDTQDPRIHLEFSRETAEFLIRHLQSQLEEDRYTLGFSSCFVLVNDDTTPEMQEYLEWQRRLAETNEYIHSCVKYRY